MKHLLRKSLILAMVSALSLGAAGCVNFGVDPFGPAPPAPAPPPPPPPAP